MKTEPYRAGTSTELAPRSLPLSFWQRVKPTARFGVPGYLALAYPGVRMIMRGEFLSALIFCSALLVVCIGILAFWSEPYRTWRQRRVLAKAKELGAG